MSSFCAAGSQVNRVLVIEGRLILVDTRTLGQNCGLRTLQPGKKTIPWKGYSYLRESLQDRKCPVRLDPADFWGVLSPVWTAPYCAVRYYSSVQFSRSFVSESLHPHELQHAMPPCPSPTPGVYSNSCPLSQWYHPTISSTVVPFSSCLQSFPASGSFFQWISSSHQVAKVLEFQLQHQSFQWLFRTDLL